MFVYIVYLTIVVVLISQLLLVNEVKTIRDRLEKIEKKYVDIVSSLALYRKEVKDIIRQDMEKVKTVNGAEVEEGGSNDNR